MKMDKRISRPFKIRKVNGTWAIFKLMHYQYPEEEKYMWIADAISADRAMELIYNVWINYDQRFSRLRSA